MPLSPNDYYSVNQQLMSNPTYRLNQNDDASYMKQELAYMLPVYQTIDDCLQGEMVIKARGELYLPKPNATDETLQNEARYKSYVMRAKFYNCTAQTLLGLLGQCYLYQPQKVTPKELEPITKNMDGTCDLEQFSKKTLSCALSHARAGLLTDFPITSGEVSQADIESGKVIPSIILYKAKQIINWRTKTINGKIVVSMVMLEECYDSMAYKFKEEAKIRYRELMLDNNNEYIVNIWEQNEDEVLYISKTYKPMMNDKPMNRIPFTFIGSETNSPDIQHPQMYDIATMNIGHYRNSADYEESSYMVGQPTPIVAGVTKDWVDDVLKGKLRLGSMGAVMLPVGGSADLLQASPNSMPMEAMKHKEDQMISLGAKMITPSGQIKTATESTMEKSEENSILTSTSKNVSMAITERLKDAYEFLTGKKDNTILFKLLTETTLQNMTSNERMQTVADWQAGLITFSEARALYTSAGIATENVKSITPPKPIETNMNDGNNQAKPSPKGTVNPSNGRDFIGNKNN